VAAAAGATAAGVTAARDIVLTHFDTSVGDAVVTQIWNAYLGDLRAWGLALCAACLLVAAAAGAPRLSARAVLAPPATPAGRLGRAAALLAVAWLAVQVPELVLHVALVTVAAALVYVAAGDVLRAIAPPRPATPRLPRPAAPARAGGTARADSSTSTSR
jgi:hypothetical protein